MWTRSRLIARIIRIPGDFPRPSINKEKSWKVCVPPRGGVTGHVSETRLQWPPLILVASGIGVHASHAMRILPSCREEETFTMRGKSTIRSVSREEGYAFAIKTATRQRITLRSQGFSLREREREGEIDQGQEEGISLVC